MNTLILGSGFGLYGYLPAVEVVSKKIFLEYKYKNKLQNLKISKKIFNKIYWYKNESNIIDKINVAVIAYPPILQSKKIKQLFKNKKLVRYLFLEKPIDKNPIAARKLIKFLIKNKVKFSFGFIFKYLAWSKLINKKKNLKNIKIIWNIKKKNASNSWKYKSKFGGGLIRYYGIHFLKLFSENNFHKILINDLKKNHWTLQIQNSKKTVITLIIKYSNKDKFLIKTQNKNLISAPTPIIENIVSKKIDPRVKILKRYINQKIRQNGDNYTESLKFVNFWSKIESSFKVI